MRRAAPFRIVVLMPFLAKLLTTKRSRLVAIIISLSIALLSSAVIIATLFVQLNRNSQIAKVPKLHSSLNTSAMQTFSESLNTQTPQDLSKYPKNECPKQTGNWIEKENLKPGVPITQTEWRKLSLRGLSGSAIWLNKTSVSCGDKLDLHASLYGSRLLDFNEGKRTFEAIRVGWYLGSGARSIWTSKPFDLKQRGIRVSSSPSRLIDTNWSTTTTISIDKNWIPGFYLILSKSDTGKIESAAPLVVRSPLGMSKLVLMHSFLTWNAYNSFGGKSAYFGGGATVVERRQDRSRIISLDRPMIGSGGFSIHRDALSLVQFLEENGINYDQVSDIDLNQWPSITQSYNGIVLGGHPEYMTRRILDTMIAARNQGINIAILGGNTGVWQVRLASSKIGQDRQIEIYRDEREDPVTQKDLVSTKFAYPAINYPATLFTGTQAGGVHVYGSLHAVTIPSWLKIPANSSINGISPESEVDKYLKIAATPPNVHILFSGLLKYSNPNPHLPTPVADVTWHVTPSGSAIFNAGLMTWSCDLTLTCDYASVDGNSRATMSLITQQVLKLWQIKAVGKTLKN